MPEPKNMHPSGGSFPLPNALIDEWMPKLKDTELRLLLVVLRQTVGRRDLKTGRSKERDWLTQSQLKRRTGRASEAVSAGIDALVKQELLRVEAEDGTPLHSMLQRRGHRSSLHFRPGPSLFVNTQRKTEHAKANTTTNSGYKIKEPSCIRLSVALKTGEQVKESSAENFLTVAQKKGIAKSRQKIRQRLAALGKRREDVRREVG